MNKRVIGFFGGLAVFIITYLLPLHGLPAAGHMCLALTLMTVVWWATQVAQPAYVGGIYLMLLIILRVATPVQVFSSSWTGSIMWLVIGAYLIAGAVRDSGFGERIAYSFIIRFVRSWNGIIVSIFVLTLIMALLIPHPWPRAFLIMSVMDVVAKSAGMPSEDRAKIGLAVFAASCPLSGVFLTGDSTLNPLAVADSGVDVTFLSYFGYMGVPMILAGALTMLLFMILFKPTKKVSIDLNVLKEKQKSLGPLSNREIRTIVWLCIAILLWLTSGLTGINVGWITLIVALMMSLPVIGEVLTAKSWSEVPVNVLVFLTSAIAIGDVGKVTGMNHWLAEEILPASMPHNIFILALLITLFAIIIHMFMGSVIAVMGVTIPAVVAATSHLGISPLAVSLIVFSVVNLHYILPFHNLAILVGNDPDTGGYTQKEVIRLGIPLTVIMFIVALIQAGWFHITGLM
ncbi:MAG: anion permease [Sporolactobacillus sp.]|jgi:di/tricarboxylate transporter|nr:anion permease [Sporolactobacillus sp.]